MFENIRSAAHGRRNELKSDLPSLKLFVERLGDAVLIADTRSDRIVAANASAHELFNLDTEAILATPLSILFPGVESADGALDACLRIPVPSSPAADVFLEAHAIALPISVSRSDLCLIAIEPAEGRVNVANEDDEDRTSRYVERLQAVLETAWQISLVQDIGKLASSTAKILHERFTYYHVRVYLRQDSELVVAAEAGDDGFTTPAPADLMAREAVDLKEMVLRDRSGHPMTDIELEQSIDFSQVAVPVAAFGEIFGVIYIQCGVDSRVTFEDRKTVSLIARQLAVGFNNIHLRDEAGKKATSDERRRLAREIHDSVAGDLAALLWQAEDLVAQLTSGSEISVDRMKEIRDTARETLAESRRAVWNLRSDTSGECPLSELLESELESLEKISGISTRLTGDYSGAGLRPEVELALLRIGQEAINNARKHSDASEVTVSLSKTGNSVTLVVEDDGRGLGVARSGDSNTIGFGLTSMQERAFSIGAELEVHSSPGEGTRIEVTAGRALE